MSGEKLIHIKKKLKYKGEYKSYKQFWLLQNEVKMDRNNVLIHEMYAQKVRKSSNAVEYYILLQDYYNKSICYYAKFYTYIILLISKLSS